MRQPASQTARGAASGGTRLSESVDSSLHRRLQSFQPATAALVEPLARQHFALEDLTESFPALLFALATGYGTNAERTAALAAVTEGLPLKEAARRLSLPSWLRKMPAGAFHAPLVHIPSEPRLTNRLLSFVPPTPASAAAWLDRVMLANALGRPELTLWVAQQYKAPRPSAYSAMFLSVLAWAWFSSAPTTLRGAQLITTLWSPTIGAKRASSEARLWRERIFLQILLGEGIRDTWLAEGSQAGFDFIALRTADDFIAEAQTMDNCLDRYGDSLQGRSARIFSVRRDGRSVANLEIAPHESEAGHPVISQLRGPHNRRAPIEIWQAAYAWLGGQSLRLADATLELRRGRTSLARAQLELWGPFLDVLPEAARHAVEKNVLLKGSARRSAAASQRRTTTS